MASIHTSRIGHRFVCWHIGRARLADQLGPDPMPVIRAQIPAADGARSLAFQHDRQFRAWDAAILARRKLRQVDRRHPGLRGEHAKTAARKPVKVRSKVHSVMQCA